MKPAIVMQSDFTGDTSAVCTMYGVCQMVDPELRVFNNTHAIPCFDTFAASFALDYVVDFWPKGTVFVSVVDPGVGTARKACVAKLKNGQYVVTPDNGTLTHLVAKVGVEEVREIDEHVNRLQYTKACSIFHGRDLFSYCAARLAAGIISYQQVGPAYPVENIVVMELPQARLLQDGTLCGMLQSASAHFGLVASNIPCALLEEAGIAYGDTLEVCIACKGQEVYHEDVRYFRSFGFVAKGEPVLMVGESLTLQIALNLRNFVQEYHVGQGPDWTITARKKTGGAQ